MKLEENYDSDVSEDEKQYSNLADAVSQLDSTRRIRPITRKELTSVVSEFYIPKQSSGDCDFVNANELAKVLSSNPTHTSISKRIQYIIEQSKTLPKPLERLDADRIQRSVGYKTIKTEFTKWDPVVEKYRLDDNLDLPLHNEKVTLKTTQEFFSQFKTQTPLEMEISKILNGVRDVKDKKAEESDSDENHKFPLTFEEMVAQKRELAQIRAKISYEEAKAHRRSKIKSKKYHKILKKDKIKKKIKDFEILQKTDPEAALRKLEELDKTRARERASLRHRNTGKWAKNLAIRAKYNKESRKVLAEQLKLSKELTQKVKNCAVKDENISDSENEAVEQKNLVTSSENPWAIQVSSEVTDFVSGCKKFWSDENKNKEAQKNKSDKNPVLLSKKDSVEGIISEEKDTQMENDDAENSELTPIPNNLVTRKIEEDVFNKAKSADSFGINSNVSSKNPKIYEAPLNLMKTGKSAFNKKCKKASLTAINPLMKSETQNIDNSELDEDHSKTELSNDTSVEAPTSTNSPKSLMNDSNFNIDSPEKILKTKKKWLYRALAQSKSENSQNSNQMKCKLPSDEADSKVGSTSSRRKVTRRNSEQEDKTVQEKKKKKKIKKKDKKKTSTDIDELFDELDGAIAAKALKKLLQIKKKLKQKKKKKNKSKNNEDDPDPDTFLRKNSTSMKPEIDVEMLETTGKETENANDDVDVPSKTKIKLSEENASAEIDPEKFIELKPKKLNTRLPNDVTNGDYLDDEEEIQRMNIAEAFNDDDAVVEFQEKKKEEEESTKFELPDGLPGWGSWGGPDVKARKRRKTRFNIPKLPKRKDHNKKDAIICEKANSNIVAHLVKEVPFPFKSVKAFESSMRNPIGREWVPETAHRKLIKKPVETELGKIIQPMDEKELLQFKKVKKSLFKGKTIKNNKKFNF